MRSEAAETIGDFVSNNEKIKALEAELAKADLLKGSYEQALNNSIKARDDIHKLNIEELRGKYEKIRVQKYNAIRSAKRAIKHKTTIAKTLINMQLDGEINLSNQQIADRCFVDIQHIKNTMCTIKKARNERPTNIINK